MRPTSYRALWPRAIDPERPVGGCLLPLAVAALAATPTRLLGPEIEPSEQNGLRIASRLMVDKLTTVRKDKLGARIGRLDQEDVVRINQAILVFLGLARSPRHDADPSDPLPTARLAPDG